MATATAFAIIMTVATAVAMTATFAVAVTTAIAVTATIAVAAAISVTAAMATATTAVVLVEKLLDRCLADLLNLPSEEKRLAGEGRIEIERHGIVVDAEHHADDVLTVIVEHWDTRADVEELLTETAVGRDENILRDIDHGLIGPLAIRLIGSEGERERVALGAIL